MMCRILPYLPLTILTVLAGCGDLREADHPEASSEI